MPCSGCGLAVLEGSGRCQALFEELLAGEFSDYRFGRFHRLMVDTYCLQHPDRYCASVKSLAAHLTGLCCAFEHGANRSVYQALRQWLDGRSPVQRSELPSFRGASTIGDVREAPDPKSYARAVEQWGRSTWGAYSALHPLAERWVQAALTRRGPPGAGPC